MKTFGTRGAAFIYSIVWHFFLCIYGNSRWNTHFDGENIVQVSSRGEKIAQKAVKYICFDRSNSE